MICCVIIILLVLDLYLVLSSVSCVYVLSSVSCVYVTLLFCPFFLLSFPSFPPKFLSASPSRHRVSFIFISLYFFDFMFFVLFGFPSLTLFPVLAGLELGLPLLYWTFCMTSFWITNTACPNKLPVFFPSHLGCF